MPLEIIWTTARLPAVVVIGFWIVLQLFSGFAAIVEHTSQQQGGGAAYLAHIGGFIAGVILSFFFRRPIKAERGNRVWS